MSSFLSGDLTQDAFLGGRIRLWQPRKGYRAGIDPVLLAAAVPASSGQSVLELGCGAGAAILCLAVRVPGLVSTGVEKQTGYAELARQNSVENGLALEVFTADLTALPDVIRQSCYDHVIANPPYYRQGAHSQTGNVGRRLALGEEIALQAWVETAARRLAPKGYLHIIQRVDRLPDLLAACSGRLGSLEVLPLAARKGRAPDLIILRARKAGRAGFVLHAPVVLHQGASHVKDGESYSSDITQVLRYGAALPWPGSR